MHRHEKNAFLKFFITYFFSVALLILIAGFFYFQQMKEGYLKAEDFSLITYARYIKIGDSSNTYSSEYHHKFVDTNNKYIDIRNFEKIGKEFTKLIPMSNNEPYLQVFKSDENFNNEVYELLLRVIAVQLLLLFIFATLSFYLAKSSLKPLKESIETLDKFAKDLIHDLNTPITAMKLNIKLLEKDPQIKNIKAIERLNKSINTVTELHENLTVLLEKRTFQIISVNIFDIVREVVHLHEPSYPNITFDISKNSLIIDTNPNALKEVLHNIISNACKYNSHNGYVRVYEENKILHIRNSGAEINETNKIFNRNYSEQNSSGIGLDIVKRLCDAMNIKIEVTSDEESNCFSLIFDK